jgi:nucleoside-triphosphatase THEP1
MKSIFILMGEPGSGKTTWLLDLIGNLGDSGLLIGGIAAPSIPNGTRSYNLMDLETGKTLPLASESPSDGWEKTGRFYFNPEAISLGNKILCNPEIQNNDLVIVDEVGPFELDGKIWADALTSLKKTGNCPLLWVIRKHLVEEVISNWDLTDPVILDIENYSAGQGTELILSVFK